MCMANLSGKKLNNAVYELIRENWPVHPSDVCRKLNLELNVSNISKIKYHFDVLKKNNKIRTKKIDRALVAWPSDIEKLRIIHDFMRDVE